LLAIDAGCRTREIARCPAEPLCSGAAERVHRCRSVDRKRQVELFRAA
jgi:hypothetical protein